MRVRFVALFAVLLVTGLSAARAEQVVQIGPASFRRSIELAGERLELRGGGLETFAGFIKVLCAAFYAPPVPVSEFPSGPSVPRRLEIQYLVPISRERFVEAALSSLREQLTPVRMQSLQERIDQLHELYRDVRPGDRYALSFHPDEGMRLELNGVELGRVEGADFADAYFDIWLGEKPVSKSLKRKLLSVQN